MPVTESLAIEQVELDQVRPDPGNPRRMTEAERDALIRSVRAHGLVEPILVRRADRTIIAGHQRAEVARIIGTTTVPVIWLDVTKDEARVVGLALNRISGSWDDELLAQLLGELTGATEVDVTLAGFADREIRDLLRSLETAEKRERPEPPSRRSDRW